MFGVCVSVHACSQHEVVSGRRNLYLQLTTSRTQGGMSRGKESRKNR